MKLLYRTRDYAFIISAIGNCLPQPGQLRNHPPKSMKVKSSQLIKFCGTLTVSFPGPKSIGLPADALVPCFLLTIWTISS